MATLRANIYANYAGQAWIALMGVAFVPLYLHILGVEAFGLVGFMVSLQAISQLLDFGVGGTVNRELSRHRHSGNCHQGVRDMVRSFEIIVWSMSLLIGAGIWLTSTGLATSWLNPQTLSTTEISDAIVIMAIAIATLWPTNFYSNGLSGLEMQGRLNLINAAFMTLRAVGVLPVLYVISPTISAFFWWYALVGISQSLTLAVTLWHALPAGERTSSFKLNELLKVRRFAGGLFAISTLSLGVTQLDRVALSALRPLEELGYYGIAMSVAAGLGRMVQPMFNALYPRFSRLVASGQQAQLIDLYRLSNQCLAVIIAAITLILILFGKDVLILWTGNEVLADKIALPLTILVVGTALNGFMNLPYALQLAHGVTRITIGANSIALLFSIPFALWVIPQHGMLGAASVWLIINIGFITIVAPITHRKFFPSEKGGWFLRDITPPILAATTAALASRHLAGELTDGIRSILALALISAVTLIVAALSSTATRGLIRQFFLKKTN